MDYSNFEKITIEYLISNGRAIIEEKLRNAEMIRRGLVVEETAKTSAADEDPWDLGRRLLGLLEESMTDVLRNHSVRFWIHLYRRLDLGPSLEHGESVTVALVRRITELAIFKHANARDAWEMELTTEVAPNRIYGGFTEKALRAAAGGDADLIFSQFSDAIAAVPMWVVTDFKSTDLYDLFMIEGLVYEYWRVTAMMRSVGKGRRLAFTLDGDWDYSGDEDIERLISSFDSRVTRGAPLSTLAGVWLRGPSDRDQPGNNQRVPAYNFWQEPTGEVLQNLGADVPATYVSNFTMVWIDLDAFTRLHAFLAPHFEERFKYSLAAFSSTLGALALIGNYPEGPIDDDYPEALEAFKRVAVSLLNVGYMRLNMSRENLGSVVAAISKSAFSPHYHIEKDEALAVLDDIVLSGQMRSRISLWSGGPLPFLVSEPGGFLMIFDNLPEILQKKFVGVKHKTTEHGIVFEDEFRAGLDAAGFKFDHLVVKEYGGRKREIDAAVKIGEKLYVLECLSMELPLDFEIGSKKTIDRRNDLLEEKIGQAQSLSAFLEENPKGTNYDYSDVSEFIHYVVTPFVEWIGSEKEKYWDGFGNPRILSSDEAIELLVLRQREYHAALV
ncbi:hypothetical protein GFM13_06670 [Rhizobium leguminosarum bv. viciae]|nr:hypothetical protein [Rhizobium leguminosarum bv. viciae]